MKERILKLVTGQVFWYLVLGIIIITLIYVFFFRRKADAFTEEQKKQIDDDVRDLSTTQEATFPDAQYSQFAEAVYQAMNFSSWNDVWTAQEQAIKDTLKQMQTDLDVAKLVQAYGSRQLHAFGFQDGPPMGMIAAIKYDQPDVAAEINEDWKAKGITYRI